MYELIYVVGENETLKKVEYNAPHRAGLPFLLRRQGAAYLGVSIFKSVKASC